MKKKTKKLLSKKTVKAIFRWRKVPPSEMKKRFPKFKGDWYTMEFKK